MQLDGLGRSTWELLDLIESMKRPGIALCSPDQRIETGSPAGELQLLVFSAIS